MEGLRFPSPSQNPTPPYYKARDPMYIFGCIYTVCISVARLSKCVGRAGWLADCHLPVALTLKVTADCATSPRSAAAQAQTGRRRLCRTSEYQPSWYSSRDTAVRTSAGSRTTRRWRWSFGQLTSASHFIYFFDLWFIDDLDCRIFGRLVERLLSS